MFELSVDLLTIMSLAAGYWSSFMPKSPLDCYCLLFANGS